MMMMMMMMGTYSIINPAFTQLSSEQKNFTHTANIKKFHMNFQLIYEVRLTLKRLTQAYCPLQTIKQSVLSNLQISFRLLWVSCDNNITSCVMIFYNDITYYKVNSRPILCYLINIAGKSMNLSNHCCTGQYSLYTDTKVLLLYIILVFLLLDFNVRIICASVHGS